MNWLIFISMCGSGSNQHIEYLFINVCNTDWSNTKPVTDGRICTLSKQNSYELCMTFQNCTKKCCLTFLVLDVQIFTRFYQIYDNLSFASFSCGNKLVYFSHSRIIFYFWIGNHHKTSINLLLLLLLMLLFCKQI